MLYLGRAVADGSVERQWEQQVAKAKETTEKIDAELKDLQATLANIEEARPFEDLTVSGPYYFCYSEAFLDRMNTSSAGGGGRQGTPTHCRGCRDDAQEGQVDRAWYVSFHYVWSFFESSYCSTGYNEKFGNLSLM